MYKKETFLTFIAFLVVGFMLGFLVCDISSITKTAREDTPQVTDGYDSYAEKLPEPTPLEITPQAIANVKAEVLGLLAKLRNADITYDYATHIIGKKLDELGLTLDDLDIIKESELKALRIMSVKSGALTELNLIRHGEVTTFYTNFNEYTLKQLYDTGLTLQDIGTNESELADFKIAFNEQKVLKWVDYLRNGSIDYDTAIINMNQELKGSELTLSDIIEEPELEALKNK